MMIPLWQQVNVSDELLHHAYLLIIKQLRALAQHCGQCQAGSGPAALRNGGTQAERCTEKGQSMTCTRCIQGFVEASAAPASSSPALTGHQQSPCMPAAALQDRLSGCAARKALRCLLCAVPTAAPWMMMLSWACPDSKAEGLEWPVWALL